MTIDIIKILFPAVTAFLIGIAITPVVTNFLYKHKMWKKKGGKKDLFGQVAKVFNSLHKEKEVNTPRMGGIVIWASVFITISIVWIISKVFPSDLTLKLDFLSRSQTWVPLTVLLLGALVGLFDDWLEVNSSRGGLPLKKRLLFVGAVGLVTSLWFFTKLGIISIGLPFASPIFVGWLIIPIFILAIWLMYSGGIIDGIDGLSGGVFAAIFGAYTFIAFFQNQIDLAAFSATIVGAILAFLWFNIPPARFYMSETGSMALTTTLAVLAFMTDTPGGGYGVVVLPIIAAPLIITTLSVIVQTLSKKFRNGKKIFKVAPVHHHFEAIGWPAYKVTMRYWVLSVVFAFLGVIIALVG